MKLPGAATPPDIPADTLPMRAVLPSPVERNPDSLARVDPFARWEASSIRPGTPPPAPGTFTQQAPAHPARSNPRSYRRPAQQDRRKLVMLIAAGTAAVFVGEIGFAHLVQSMKRSPSQIPNVPATGSTSAATPSGKTPTTGSAKGIQTTSTPSRSPTAKPSPTKVPQPSPTSQPTRQPTPQPMPTQPPTPTPTPPSHTGTVIGSTTQPTNSSNNFTNPADGQGSLLLHLSNGNFVACERACTHAGVPVNYDPGSGQLVCPAHGAIFDPLHGFSHVSGPGKGPLATVSIRVNADGTITTG
jgi:Rieske Fe-S protein